jgi:hypothetical protein
MNRTVVLLTAFALGVALVGCGQPYMEEAYYLDKEFGKATAAAFDKQVVNPEPLKRDVVPEGVDGIHAEQVMDVHDSTYGTKPAKNPVLKMGLVSEGK